MNYEKPNVALVSSAVQAVKGTQAKDDTPIDGSVLVSDAAYESDE